MHKMQKDREKLTEKLQSARDKLTTGVKLEFPIQRDLIGLVVGKGGRNVIQVQKQCGVDRIARRVHSAHSVMRAIFLSVGSRTRVTMHLCDFAIDVEVTLADLNPPPLTVKNDLKEKRLLVAFDPDDTRSIDWLMPVRVHLRPNTRRLPWDVEVCRIVV